MSNADISQDETSQQDLRVLLDHAPDAIGRFDRQLRHVYVNQATAQANARPASDFIGKTMEQLGHAPEVCELINSKLRGVFVSGQERIFDLMFQGPNGNVWYQCRMAPEIDSQGNVEYVLVVSRDISEQRRAEAALIEAEKRAAAVQLATILGHELNNPLAVLTNAVYLLQNKNYGSLHPESRELLDLVSVSLDRVAEISRKILSLNNLPGPQVP
jgi:PAS domain S-box-containing protein